MNFSVFTLFQWLLTYLQKHKQTAALSCLSLEQLFVIVFPWRLQNFKNHSAVHCALTFVDCMFICPSVLIYVFEAFELEVDWYNYLFPVVFYPCSEIALCSSIYMTMAIAVERFIGLSISFDGIMVLFELEAVIFYCLPFFNGF